VAREHVDGPRVLGQHAPEKCCKSHRGENDAPKARESYRRRSPGKPIIEDYYSELGAKLTLSQPLKIDDVPQLAREHVDGPRVLGQHAPEKCCKSHRGENDAPGKPIIEDYYSELGAKLTLSQPLKIDDVHGRAPARLSCPGT
jgi:ribosomal protein L20A (L18A)